MTTKDRRRAARFEFVEEQWGSLQALEPLRLRNVALEGALIDSSTPLAVGSIHEIRLEHRSVEARCHVAVRHLSPGIDAGDGQQYAIGLEFIDLDDRAMVLIKQILAEPADPAVPIEA